MGQANRNIKLTSSKIESACDYTSLHAHILHTLPSLHTDTHTLTLSKAMQLAPWPAALFM